ncbi:MAG: tryptophan--tRNA ligase [Candidatus Nanoarchaeia archaeon]|nr:tryptophan--tRNA ligase [Candidatus Nanoarchaeia archaeon]
MSLEDIIGLKMTDEKLDEFGLERIDRVARYLPEQSRYMRRGITYAHRGFEEIAELLMNGKDITIVSGLNPSGPLHFGHLVIFNELLFFQKLGAEIFIPITNDETYVVGKSDTLSKARKNAYEQVIPSIIALGFDPKKTHIYVDSDYKDLYNFAMYISKKINYSTSRAVFGFKDEDNMGTMFYRACVQTAQILMPQLPEFGGPKHTLIPVGIDQDPYILLSRDFAKKFKMKPPAGLYMQFMKGLNGGSKMSKSIPGSAIYVTDSEKEIRNKIMNAFTGGGDTLKEHKEKGGNPEVCPIYQMYEYHFVEDDNELDEICKTCRKGTRSCGDCKKELVNKVIPFLKEHQEKRKKVTPKMIGKYLLDKELNSFLKY